MLSASSSVSARARRQSGPGVRRKRLLAPGPERHDERMSRDEGPPARWLYPFRKQDPLTLKWYRARWKASLEEIAAHGWKVDGPPMVIGRYGDTSAFMAHAKEDLRPLPPMGDLALPSPSDDERWLVTVFLRRYVTWCARRGHDERAMQAALLWREVQASDHVRVRVGLL